VNPLGDALVRLLAQKPLTPREAAGEANRISKATPALSGFDYARERQPDLGAVLAALGKSLVRTSPVAMASTALGGPSLGAPSMDDLGTALMALPGPKGGALPFTRPLGTGRAVRMAGIKPDTTKVAGLRADPRLSEWAGTEVGPRRVGGTYRSAYGGEAYKVLDIQPDNIYGWKILVETVPAKGGANYGRRWHSTGWDYGKTRQSDPVLNWLRAEMGMRGGASTHYKGDEVLSQPPRVDSPAVRALMKMLFSRAHSPRDRDFPFHN